MKIPFAKPYIGQEEINAVTEVLKSRNLALGKKVKEFEEKFAEYVGGKYGVAFNGCTNALRSAIDVTNPDLEVKIPAITYTATASIVVDSGRLPVFVDIDKDDLSGKADIVVHLTGIKSKYKAKIYDSAHRIEKNDIKDSDTIWCYSFYATKNMTTGYGGMAVTNNKDYYERLKLIQDDGRKKFKNGYTVLEAVGGRDMNDITAAIGIEQLKKLPEMTRRRNEIVKRYNNNLGLSHTGNHLYPVLVSNRVKFFEAMEQANIQCLVHFRPLHKMPAYENYCNDSLPNAEYLGERLVSLPLFIEMTDQEIDYVSDKVLKTTLLIN